MKRKCKYCTSDAEMKGYRDNNGVTSSEIVCNKCNSMTSEELDYPFNEGDDYWTIEDGKVVWGCWDEISEEMFNLNTIYFTSEGDANKYLNQ